MGDHCCKPRVVIPLCLLLNIVLDVAVGFPELFSADTVVSRNSVHRNAFPLQVVRKTFVARRVSNQACSVCNASPHAPCC